MTTKNKINAIRYALDHLHIQGRRSLEVILSVMRNLRDWEENSDFDYKTIQLLLEEITVCGEEDVNHLLACIQMLDELIEEENNGAKDQ